MFPTASAPITPPPKEKGQSVTETATRPAPSPVSWFNPALLNLIRTTPSHETVRGFIRRDLKLVLPAEIQAAGTDAIIKWVHEEKMKEPVPVVVTPPPAPKKWRINVDRRVTWTEYFGRIDNCTVAMEVPERVIGEALEAENYEIISDWIAENYSTRHIVARDEGQSSDGDSGDIEEEHDDVASTQEVEEKFQELMENRNE